MPKLLCQLRLPGFHITQINHNPYALPMGLRLRVPKSCPHDILARIGAIYNRGWVGGVIVKGGDKTCFLSYRPQPKECFIQGTVYCCADIAGVPEVTPGRKLKTPFAILIWEFPKIRVTTLGVTMLRLKVFCSLYWFPFILGNYHLCSNHKT